MLFFINYYNSPVIRNFILVVGTGFEPVSRGGIPSSARLFSWGASGTIPPPDHLKTDLKRRIILLIILRDGKRGSVFNIIQRTFCGQDRNRTCYKRGHLPLMGLTPSPSVLPYHVASTNSAT